MKKIVITIIILLVLYGIASSAGGSSEEQVSRSAIQTQTVSFTSTPKPTQKSTATPKPTSTKAPTSTPIPTSTPVPTVASTSTPVPTQEITKSGDNDSKGEFRKAADPADYDASKTTTYVLNTNTKKFHYPECNDVKKMSTKNRQDVNWSRSKVVSNGYSPCGHCHP